MLDETTPAFALRSRARFLALRLAHLDPARQAGELGEILSLVLEHRDDHADALEELVQHLEVMAPADQIRFIEAYATTSGRSVAREARRVETAVRDQLRATGVIGPEPTPPGAVTVDGGHVDVVLVVPAFLSAETFLQPPICLLLAASRLRAAGWRVRLVDNRTTQLPPDELAAAVPSCEVLFVTTTPYDHIQNYFLDYRLRHAFATIDALKHVNPDVPLVACGAHGTVRPDIVLQACAADFVLKGEYDAAIPTVVGALAAGRDPAALTNVIGRDARSPEPQAHGALEPYRVVVLRKTASSRGELDDADLRPAYDLVDFDDYYGDVYVRNQPTRQRRWGAVLATRGCAFDCSFCYNFWDRRVRYRDAGSVVEELAYLERDRSLSGLFFLDFHFTQNLRWVSDLCGQIRRAGITLPWSAQARCDAVPIDILEEMAGAGCSHLWFGVETLDDDITDRLGKYPDLRVPIEAIESCRRVGIEPHLFLMIGLPGETRSSLNHTIKQLHALRAPFAGVMPATPRFGTRYYQLAKQQYPELGSDFYSLRSVRGLVANDLTMGDLEDALTLFSNRDFLYASSAPQL